MGHLERRLRRLEVRLDASTESLALMEQAQLQHAWALVLSRLTVADLRTLDEVLVAMERGENFREAVDRLGAQAVVDRFERACENLRTRPNQAMYACSSKLGLVGSEI